MDPQQDQRRQEVLDALRSEVVEFQARLEQRLNIILTTQAPPPMTTATTGGITPPTTTPTTVPNTAPGPGPYYCNECTLDLLIYSCHQIHLDRHHGSRQMYSCLHCHHVFNSEYILARHYANTH